MRRCLVTTLLCLLSLSAAHGQFAPRPHTPLPPPASCGEALLPTPAHGDHIVSARQLTIPPAAWELYRRAALAYKSGHTEQAEAEAAKALALAPRFAEVHLLRAVAALAAGRSADTLTLLTQARTLAPDLPWLGIGAAGALNNLHRYDDALTELATIPATEAAGWEATYERARAEVGLLNTPAALDWSQRAVTLAPPGCTDARLVHANALHLAGRTVESIHELEVFLSEDRRGAPRPNVVAALSKARAAIAAANSSPSPNAAGLLAMK